MLALIKIKNTILSVPPSAHSGYLTDNVLNDSLLIPWQLLQCVHNCYFNIGRIRIEAEIFFQKQSYHQPTLTKTLEQVPLEKSSSFLLQKQTKHWLKHWNVFSIFVGESWFLLVPPGGKSVRRRLNPDKLMIEEKSRVSTFKIPLL